VLYKYVKHGGGALWFNEGTVAAVEGGRIVGIVARDFTANFQKRVILP